MVERLLDILIIKPTVSGVVRELRKEGFAIACSTGLKSDGALHRSQGEEWWKDLWIYDAEIPHYESQLPPHRRSFLTDKLTVPLNEEPFNEIPVARILVSRNILDKRGLVIGPFKLSRPEIYLHDPYFGNDPRILERLRKAANRAFMRIENDPILSNYTNNYEPNPKVK